MSALDLLPDYVREQITNKVRNLRDDLLAIPHAEANGWKVSFRNDHWHNSAEFTKGAKHIWYVGPEWRAADLVDGRYVNHRLYKTLREALTFEGGPLT